MVNDQVKKALVASKRALYESSNINVDFNTFRIVWYNYTLGNQKYLIMSPVVDGLYLEVTYNSRTEEYYVDIYQKQSTTAIASETL